MIDLVPLIREFVELVSPMVKVSDGVDEVHLSADGTLSLWMQVPDCSYKPMFLGWLLAQGHNINSFSPAHLEQAVQHALVGENKNVMFDYLGDWDAKDKPH
jgi:hypothetical protein